MDRIIAVSEGNPGALTVFQLLLERYPEKIELILDMLEKYNIRGSNLWVLYKQCHKDIAFFVSYVIEELVNEVGRNSG
jgi:hypothetical protein